MKQLKDIMNKDVMCMKPSDTLQAIAEKMRELDTGSIPICDNGRLAGMVTDRDIVIKGIAASKDPQSTTAREVMTSPIVYGFEDQDLGDAAHMMEEKQIRRLLVLNRAKKLVGIVSLADIATRGSEELVGEMMEKITEVTPPGAAVA